MPRSPVGESAKPVIGSFVRPSTSWLLPPGSTSFCSLIFLEFFPGASSSGLHFRAVPLFPPVAIVARWGPFFSPSRGQPADCAHNPYFNHVSGFRTGSFRTLPFSSTRTSVHQLFRSSSCVQLPQHFFHEATNASIVSTPSFSPTANSAQTNDILQKPQLHCPPPSQKKKQTKAW